MQLARRRDDDSLVASMNALRRFEAEREARSQEDDALARQRQLNVEMERWRHEQAAQLEDVQRAALAEAELNEAERRRYEAEVFAAVMATAPKQRMWLRVSTLVLLFVFAAAAGVAYALETRENEAAAKELGAAIVAQRAAVASETAARAELARSAHELQAAREELAQLKAGAAGEAQPWVEPSAMPLLGAPAAVAPAAAPAAPSAPTAAAVVPPSTAPVTTPLVPEAAPEAAPAPAAAADEPAKAKRVASSSRSSHRSRHADHGDQAKADAPAAKPGKPAKLDMCPPGQPICK